MKTEDQGWRRVGTAVALARATLATSVALALVGLLALPGYRPGYNDRYYLRAGTPVNRGYAAADRHFGPARMVNSRCCWSRAIKTCEIR